MGNTTVLCVASVVEETPPFLRDTGQGWLTAEYAMLPRATDPRSPRGRVTGRTYEIQRLIGRSLRAVLDLTALAARTIYVDCDVIQADGGTRTASITGGFVATALLFQDMVEHGLLERWPFRDYVAAVSVGMVDDEVLLDLDYYEDSRAQVDMNVVMTGKDQFVEIQGTAEQAPFGQDTMEEMVELARRGIATLIDRERTLLAVSG